MSKIVRFTAENVKKLKAVEIFPEDLGNVVIISGKNRQGKSSIIEAIQMTLEGSGFKFSKPVNNTKTEDEESYIELELDDLIIRRHWTSNEKSYLNVLTKDGARYPSPQSMLDKMKGAISLDPAEFQMLGKLNDGEKKQVEYLIKALKVNTKTLDMKYSVVYEERKDINRELNRIKALIKDLPEPELNLPDEEISIIAITDEIQKANQYNSDIDRQKRICISKDEDIKRLDLDVTRFDNDMGAIDRKITALQNEKAAIEKAKTEKINLINTLRKDLDKTKAEVAKLGLIDINPLQMQISTAEETNRKIRNRNNRSNYENEAGELFEKSESKTLELENIKKEKADLISKANFPIEGLFYDENGIYVNEIPFNQLSESEQFKFSTLIAMAANPELRVIASKHGGIFDQENLALLIELIKDKDYQLWLEKVEENKLPTIIIEEGRVKEVRKK